MNNCIRIVIFAICSKSVDLSGASSNLVENPCYKVSDSYNFGIEGYVWPPYSINSTNIPIDLSIILQWRYNDVRFTKSGLNGFWCIFLFLFLFVCLFVFVFVFCFCFFFVLFLFLFLLSFLFFVFCFLFCFVFVFAFLANLIIMKENHYDNIQKKLQVHFTYIFGLGTNTNVARWQPHHIFDSLPYQYPKVMLIMRFKFTTKFWKSASMVP